MIIKHKGRMIDTKLFDGTIEKDIIDNIRAEFYKEDKELALKQLRNILLDHKTMSNHTYAYYFERIANDTVLDGSKWSINEMLESDELTQLIYNRTKFNKKVFDSESNTRNFKTAIRLGGRGVASKPTQFPIKVMRSLLDEFTNEGDVYYDPCMGWGMRMMCAAEKGLYYVGNDVNYDLMVKLKELKEDIQTIKPFNANLIYEGSEVFQKGLVNRVDFIFTSPPYFDLEVYKGSENLKNQNYSEWLEQFIKPMLQNCLQYIKDDKYVLINIKNTKKYSMYDDTMKIAKSIGFEYKGHRELNQSARPKNTGDFGDGSEKIMVLQKQKNGGVGNDKL